MVAFTFDYRHKDERTKLEKIGRKTYQVTGKYTKYSTWETFLRKKKEWCEKHGYNVLGTIVQDQIVSDGKGGQEETKEMRLLTVICDDLPDGDND